MPDRELGGYANANALAGGGPSIREVSIVLSPAIATTLQGVEQTFTVPGLLATDRIAYCQPTTGAVGLTSILAQGTARVSAISVVAIPYVNTGTATTPTTSATYVFGIASARLIP
ncbi:MAG: hypothetical protein NUW01_18575, partial [Gemmatimonadaceae bacterium]|nr:hypothetical protein [Gemmatimonadaceae bacterium]